MTKFVSTPLFESIMRQYHGAVATLSDLVNQCNDEIEDLNVVLFEKTTERDKASEVLQKMQSVFGDGTDGS